MAERDTATVAGELVEKIGQSFTAIVAGVTDGELPLQWAEGTQIPDEAISMRLQAADSAVRLISQRHGVSAASVWLVLHDDGLGESPAAALAADRYDDVARAADLMRQSALKPAAVTGAKDSNKARLEQDIARAPQTVETLRRLIELAHRHGRTSASALTWLATPSGYFDGEAGLKYLDMPEFLLETAKNAWGVDW